jgi:UDP-glucose 4-epimerase
MNAATGTRITLNDTFKLLREITDYKGEPSYDAERAGDIRHSLADIGMARELIGYEPPVDFEEGLKRTVEWYRGFGK